MIEKSHSLFQLLSHTPQKLLRVHTVFPERSSAPFRVSSWPIGAAHIFPCVHLIRPPCDMASPPLASNCSSEGTFQYSRCPRQPRAMGKRNTDVFLTRMTDLWPEISLTGSYRGFRAPSYLSGPVRPNIDLQTLFSFPHPQEFLCQPT